MAKDTNNKKDKMQDKLNKLQYRQILKKDKEIKDLRKQLTALLNYQKLQQDANKDQGKHNKKLEEHNKALEKANKDIMNMTKDNLELSEQLLQAQKKGDTKKIKQLKQSIKQNNDMIKTNKSIVKDNKEMIKELESLNDSMDNLSDTMEELPKSFGDTLHDAFETLALNDIRNSLDDNTKSLREQRNDFYNSARLNKTEAKNFDKMINSLYKESKASNLMANDEFERIIFETFNELGLRDEKLIASIGDEVAKMTQTLDVSFNNASSLVQLGEKSLQSLQGALEYSRQVDKNFDMQGFIDSANNVTKSMQGLGYSNTQIDDVLKRTSILQANLNKVGLNDFDAGQMMADAMTKTQSDFIETYGNASAQYYNQLKSGDINALLSYINSATNMVQQGARAEDLQNMYGFDEEAYKTLRSKVREIAEIPTEVQKGVATDTAKLVQEMEENYFMTLTDRISSWFKQTTAPLASLFGGEIGLTDVFTMATGMKSMIDLGKGAKAFLGKKAVEGVGTAGASAIGGQVAKTGIGSLLKGGAKGLLAKGGISALGSSALGGLGTLVGGVSLSALAPALLGVAGVGSALFTMSKSRKKRNQAQMNADMATDPSEKARLQKIADQRKQLSRGGIFNPVGNIVNAFASDDTIETMILTKEKAKKIASDVLSSVGNVLGGFVDNTIGWFKDKFTSLFRGKENKEKNRAESKSSFNIFNWGRKDADGSHRNGLEEVPYDGYKAVLHSRERVLTADEAQAYKNYEAEMNMRNYNASQSEGLKKKLMSKDVLGKAQETARQYYADALALQTPVVQEAGGTPGSALPPGDFIGKVSSKYEINYPTNRGDFISNGGSWGDPGGTSYGLPQFATNTGSAKSFAKWLSPKINSNLGNLTPNTSAFNSEWKAIASKIGLEAFEKYQGQYAYDTFGKPFGDKWLQATGLTMKNRGFQEMLYSAGIQHGSGTAKKYASGINSSMTDTQVVDKFYNNRATLNSTSGSIRKSLANRFNKEKEDIKALLKDPPAYEQGTPFVPSTQVALLHKGEMVVPKSQNPYANPSKTKSISDDATLSDVIKILKEGFEFLGKKLSEEKIVTDDKTRTSMRSLKDVFSNYTY